MQASGRWLLGEGEGERSPGKFFRLFFFQKNTRIYCGVAGYAGAYLAYHVDLPLVVLASCQIDWSFLMEVQV